MYLLINAHWESRTVTLPSLPEGWIWEVSVNTGDPASASFDEGGRPAAGLQILAGARSVLVLTAVSCQK